MTDPESRRVPAGITLFQGPSLEEPWSSPQDVRVWRVGGPTNGSIAVIVEGGDASTQELYIPAKVYLDLPL